MLNTFKDYEVTRFSTNYQKLAFWVITKQMDVYLSYNNMQQISNEKAKDIVRKIRKENVNN